MNRQNIPRFKHDPSLAFPPDGDMIGSASGLPCTRESCKPVYILVMLFMVIEHFKNGDFNTVGDRFQRSGRMLPEAVIYRGSWIDAQNGRCWQIMEAPDRESLDPWIAAWDDLGRF